MDRKRAVEIIKDEKGSTRGPSDKGYGLPPWLFQHNDLTHALEQADPVSQHTLTNTLNYIHFVEGYLLVRLKHPRYDESILLRAYPEPCLGKELTCSWVDPTVDVYKYRFQHIVIDDGQSMILVPSEEVKLGDGSFRVVLPEKSFAVGKRQARRYPCREVSAELDQSGFLARGRLLNYNPFGFCIRVKASGPSSFHWFNPEELSVVYLTGEHQILFSGSCRCIRYRDMGEEKELVLSPTDQQMHRFGRKQIRNPRQRLVPSPNLVFMHPFLKKQIQLEVVDICTSGFSVEEKMDEGILMQGMIIPELKIKFAGATSVTCSAQVIYRREENDNLVKCGLGILDMDIADYSRLTHILSTALDPNAYVCCEVDMGELWEFFFDTGFIYPTKYRLIQSHKEAFKKTYEKLYQDNPEIAKHFTYQRNGRIYGHIAMVRAYKRAWMIHHHAARAMESKRAGFIVLKQIMHYLNDMHRLPSAKMDYVMSYFRPENKFPDRVFGGFARSLNNPGGCSLDLFAYLPYTGLSLGTQLPESWTLRKSTRPDLWELNTFYNHHSGGLLLKAMGLSHDQAEDGETIEEVYERLGFFRKQEVYSLCRENELTAVLIVNRSDLGFNLSELLNGIKVLAISQESLPWNILSTAIARLTRAYDMERIPVLFYPLQYVKAEKIPYEKSYFSWVLNVRYGDQYMKYMQKRFRITYKAT